MTRYRKIVWNEGMLLTPHHFQQWDNYYEELLSSRFASLSSFEWGALDFHANSEAIGNGNFDILRCRAVMPDGLLINIPAADSAQPPRPIDDHFDPAPARLAL